MQKTDLGFLVPWVVWFKVRSGGKAKCTVIPSVNWLLVPPARKPTEMSQGSALFIPLGLPSGCSR